MKNRLKDFFRNIKGAVVSSYMCLRFPFLYPRHAMTGLHRTCWTIRNYHREHYKNCVLDVYINTTKVDNIMHDNPCGTVYGMQGTDIIGVLCANNQLIINTGEHKPLMSIDINELFEVVPSAYYITMSYDTNRNFIVVSVMHVDGTDYKYGDRPNDVKFLRSVVTNKLKYRWIKFLDWVEAYPYQWINCIPTHSWYDSIPYGWRKSFGMQFMKELKTELLRVGGHKALKSLSITDIKEKWGSLQVYCSGPGDVQKIIEKYEYISFRTCINCGRPAEGVTNGYVLPYCKDCFEKSKSMSMTPFFTKDNTWYGYTIYGREDIIMNTK